MSILTTVVFAAVFANLVHTNTAWLFKRSSKPLAIDGGWSEWSNWTSCHKNVPNNKDYFSEWQGFNVGSKHRICDSPLPLNGGKDCEGSTFRHKLCGCNHALGLENGRIQDNQLASSSEADGFPAQQGRLKSKTPWCAQGRILMLANIYFQINFKSFVELTGIATEGSTKGRITRYRLTYSVNGKPNSWTSYHHKHGVNKPKIFSGNVVSNDMRRNDLKRPVIAKSIRLYPVDGFGSVCLKMELYGCEFTCGQLFTKPSGNIIGRSSELYDQNCIWRVTVANTTIITLDFVIFDLPCENGFVEVKDTSGTFSESNSLGRFCGDGIDSLKKFNANDLWIHFKSNSSMEEIGFNMRYMSSCEEAITLLPKQEITVMSPRYPDDYPHNTDCKWLFSTLEGHMIHIEFLDFDVEESRWPNNCSNDYIRISDTGSLRTFCNTKKPSRLVTTAQNNLELSFKTDDAIGGRGFKIKVISFDPSTDLKTTETTTVAYSNPFTPKSDVTIDDKPRNLLYAKEPLTTSRPFNVIQNVELTNGSRNHHLKTKDTIDGDDTWTIIIIGAFSGIVLVLIIIVGGINVHRCIHSQNMYAQAKIGQKVDKDRKNMERERKRKLEKEQSAHLTQVVEENLTPRIGSPIDDDFVVAVVVPGTAISVEANEIDEKADNEAPLPGKRMSNSHEEPDKDTSIMIPLNKEEPPSQGIEDPNDTATPEHMQVSTGESSSLYDFVDCCDELDEITQQILDCVKDTENGLQQDTNDPDGCTETVV